MATTPRRIRSAPAPYMLKEWKRGVRRSRSTRIPTTAASRGISSPRTTRGTKDVVKDMRGKRMPQIGRVEIQHHRGRPVALARVQPEGARLPRAARDVSRPGVRRGQQAEAGVDGAGRVALHARSIRTSATRSSISAIRWSAASRRKRSRCAARSSWATSSTRRSTSSASARRCRRRCRFRSGVVGHDPRYQSINQYDPALANKLLDYFGYKKGADGYRTLPDGKPLVLRHGDTAASAIDRAFNELWQQVDGCHRHPHGVRHRASSPTT